MTLSTAGTYTGKVAFVTGAGSGIGRATAIAFAKAGASVTAVDISEKKVYKKPPHSSKRLVVGSSPSPAM